MMLPSIHIIYASTSGHTEYVIEQLASYLKQRIDGLTVEKQKAEFAKGEDLRRADVLILASGTWNTGGIEGQLNVYMHQLLFERGKDIDLTGKMVALISLGDDRYYYTTRCTEHFMRFIKLSHAKTLFIPLIVVNEPYGQEERVQRWGEKLIASMQAAHLLEPPSQSSAV